MRSQLICILFLLACASPEPQRSTIEQIIGTSERGVIRGMEVGDSQADVLIKETEKVLSNEPNELTCRLPLSQKDSTYCDITYHFSDAGLYKVELDVFPVNQDQSNDLFAQFKASYDHRFGASSVDDGFTMWNVRSFRGSNIEVSMIDEGLETGMPYLSIIFLETQID